MDPDGAVLDATAAVDLVRFDGPRSRARSDLVAREEPLEIRIDGASLAVVMRTPGHDAELALGFLATERVVRRPGDVASVRHCSTVPEPESEENILQVVLAPGVTIDLDALRRNLYASSSCGICGKATIEHAMASAPPLGDESRFPAELLYELPARLGREQAAFARTGGLHAAALFDREGALLVAREDVGRHNAVDKVVGWALRRGPLPLRGHVLLVSGRVSYEVAQKALSAGIPVVAAVSAPSSLAVDLARRAGLTVVGFLRGRSLNVYGDTSRIVAGSPGATDRRAP